MGVKFTSVWLIAVMVWEGPRLLLREVQVVDDIYDFISTSQEGGALLDIDEYVLPVEGPFDPKIWNLADE